jgi:hypothetical protein
MTLHSAQASYELNARNDKGFAGKCHRLTWHGMKGYNVVNNVDPG